MQKAEEAARTVSDVSSSATVITKSTRAPEIRIEGEQAIQFGIPAAKIYSGYIQAIFDIFD